MKLGPKVASRQTPEEEVKVYGQDEAFGEVLISTTGEECTVDEVIWVILECGTERALTKDTLFCVILDMCRSSKKLLKGNPVVVWVEKLLSNCRVLAYNITRR